MRDDGACEVRQGIELLKLTRSHNGQQPFDGAFALFAPGAEHDLAPLDRAPARVRQRCWSDRRLLGGTKVKKG
jgi:hypothetical protein